MLTPIRFANFGGSNQLKMVNLVRYAYMSYTSEHTLLTKVMHLSYLRRFYTKKAKSLVFYVETEFWDPIYGQLSMHTWISRHTFENHVNRVSKSKMPANTVLNEHTYLS